MSRNKSPSKRGARPPTVNLVSVTQALLVSEHLSFRRAASVLGVRQSAISRRVRALEDELGVSLFERNRSGVRVTNAGVRFLQQAREAIGQLDYAAKTAGSAGRGAVGRLSIGILSSMAAGFLRELIKGYSELHPDVAIQILEGASVEHVTAVRKRQLDVAFVLDTTEAAGCELAPLWNERIFVVLPEHHSLRRRKQIEWQDLSNERLIVRQSERDPALCDRLTRRLTDGDQTPRVEKLDVGRETLMHLVSLGRGVGFTSESTVATPFPKVVFRPVAGDNELLQFCAAWSPDNDNPALRRFLSLARTMAKEKRQGPGNGSGPVSSRSTVATGVTLLLAFLGALARRLGLLT